MLFKYFLDPSGDDWTVMVVEDGAEPSSGHAEIESFGVWNT